jgi:hypothetical protein
LTKSVYIYACCILFFAACQKESESFRSEYIADYYPLRVGNYIEYQLDSTVYVNLGTEKEIHSYIIRDLVDSIITDNLERPSYKIKRSIRNLIDTTKWDDIISYLITYDSTKLECIENNLRYVKLQEPISTGFTWKGNTFINTTSVPELLYLNDWQYIYEQVRRPYTINGISYTETVTVNQRNDSLGTPGDKEFFFEQTYAKEVYAKSIGLIYKEFLHEAWQPINVSSNSGYYESNSYGIKLTMLRYNY